MSILQPRRCLAALGLAVCLACAPPVIAQEGGESPPAARQGGQSSALPLVQVPAESKVGGNYVIGPGDSLQVFVWRHAELTATVPVRPDGKISTPLVEDVVAVGKTPAVLARDIEKVLSEYVRSPQVNIIVTQPVSTFSQVMVIGQVTTPQALPFREGMTVLDAVLAVGGLGSFAAGNRAKVVRKEDGKQRELKVRLSDLVKDGDLRHNIELRPGDVLVVPESLF
jgi:polysaccharide biosynthesis/export protein